MKVLIWIGCMFINAVITVLLNSQGILLGGIPTALLFFGCFMLAKVLAPNRADDYYQSLTKF